MSDYVKTNAHIAALFILANFVVDAAGMNAANKHHPGLFFKIGSVAPQHIEGPPNIEAKRMIIVGGLVSPVHAIV